MIIIAKEAYTMKVLTKRPLQTTLIFLFTSLFLVFGLVVVTVNFKLSLDLAKSNVEQTMDVIGDFSAVTLKSMFLPIEVEISVSEQQVISSLKDQDRSNISPIMTNILNRHANTMAVYIGWDDGDFMIYRHADRNRHPMLGPDAFYTLEYVERGPEGITNKSLYELSSQGSYLAAHDSKYSLDPRTREWFRLAKGSQNIVHTAPYAYFTENVLGITLAKHSNDFVLGVDISLSEIGNELGSINYFPEADYFLLDQNKNVISSNNTEILSSLVSLDTLLLSDLESSKYSSPELSNLEVGSTIYEAGRQSWYASSKVISTASNKTYFLLSIVSSKQVFSSTYNQLYISLFVGLIIISLALMMVWLVSKRLSASIELLSEEAAHLAGFDFSKKIHTDSPITEVSVLADSMLRLQKTVRSFSNISLKIQNSLSHQDLYNSLLLESSLAMETPYGCLYCYDQESESYLLSSELDSSTKPHVPVTDQSWSTISRLALEEIYKDKSDRPGMDYTLAVALKNSPLRFIHQDQRFARLNNRSRCLLLPLSSKVGEPLGLIVLISEKETKLDIKQVRFGNVFAQFANSALENYQLYEQQKALLNSFIKLIASAIDAKSHYTGGHCERVPELTQMLVAKAEASMLPEYAEFQLDEDDWEAIRIGSWLHDCGKVTTPEFVVDKATKLETITNRIDEIRTRFELLKQYEETKFYSKQVDLLALQGQVVSSAELADLEATKEKQLAQLDDEFEFVASCNVGSEFMSNEKKVRLAGISQRTWIRTLNDQLGLSWAELERKPKPPQSLPVIENLLANKAEHKIIRSEGNRFGEGNPWGFKMDVPELLYDRGELYNLQVEKGTLTTEERFKINEHIIQTIIMLEELPLPTALKAIPEIATGHHERMDGEGYPRKLMAAQMSLPSRAMVIADVFEALTANDRPYKRAKTLGESIHIMLAMMCDNHLDPGLLELFIEQEVYRDYADKFLDEVQNNPVDKQAILKSISEFRASQE
ncbi:MAG: HD-GYP domain-containing protein (c-di-GMP phosphodiesterase class II) [Reinekea sp.]